MENSEKTKLNNNIKYIKKKKSKTNKPKKSKKIIINKSTEIKKNKCNILIFEIFLSFSILLLFFSMFRSLNFYKNENQKLKQILNKNFFMNNSAEINFSNNDLIIRIKEKYEKDGFVNINEVESSIPNGRPWTKRINKEKEINVGAAFDERYILKSMFTLASIMDSQKLETLLILHLAVVDNFSVENMLKVYTLRERIRDDVEFIFYNAKRSEIDFKGIHTKGNSVCARLLLPELMPDDIERLIIFDTGDAMVLRDLTEMYHWDMKGKLYSGVIDGLINTIGRVSKKPLDIYINTGNYLVDVKKVKLEKMYDKYVKYKEEYRGSRIADQDLLNDVAIGQIGYMPMRFGLISPYESDKDSDDLNAKSQYGYVEKARHKEETPFLPKSQTEVTLKAFNPVVIHQWNGKWMDGKGLSIYRRIAQYYIRFAGIWDEMCQKHPGFCSK